LKLKLKNIKIAIRNDGAEDKLFPNVDSIYNKTKDIDPVGSIICPGIFH